MLNYQKHLVSLEAAFPNSHLPSFFSSSLLLPQDNWFSWIDGHGFGLVIDSEKKISLNKNKTYFLSDPCFHSSYHDLLPHAKKSFWIGGRAFLLWFFLDARNVFRIRRFNKRTSSQIPILSLPWNLTFEIFLTLTEKKSLPENWAFPPSLGDVKYIFRDLTGPPEMLKIFPSLLSEK